MPDIEIHPDKIGGPTTDALDGLALEYRYSTGNHYRLSFGPAGVWFHLLGDVDEFPRGPLPYRARELRDRMYLVSWIVRPGIHVALVVDLDQSKIHVSAMMPPTQWEFFDIGEILAVEQADPALIDARA